jgi:hypothetical protein
MKLNKKGKLVRFGYCMGGVPYQTTLCRFFWRTFIFMPLFFLLVAAGVVTCLASFWFVPGMAFGVVGILFSIALLTVILSYVEDRRYFPMASYAVRNSVFGQGVKAIKSKICPFIDFE